MANHAANGNATITFTMGSARPFATVAIPPLVSERASVTLHLALSTSTMGANGAMGAGVRRMKSSIFRSFKEIFSAGQVDLIRSVGKGSTFEEILNLFCVLC